MEEVEMETKVDIKKVITVRFDAKSKHYRACLASAPENYIFGETMDRVVRNLCNASFITGQQLATDYVVHYLPSQTVIDSLV